MRSYMQAVKEPIVVRVNSDVADELHVHSEPRAHLQRRAAARPVISVHASTCPDKVDVELHQLNKHHRHHRRAVKTDRSAVVLAHGLGGSTDLPIPYTYALIGAAWALTFTFAVVALAWRRPRFDPGQPGRPLPPWVTTWSDAPVTRWAVGAPDLLFAVWVAVAAFFGPQNAENPLPGVFYVLLWVGLVALSLALGPVWRAISPVRTVYRLLRARTLAARVSRTLGYWPAALGLFAFVWLELASPDPGSLAAIRLWLLVYLAVTLAGALWCGDRWCARADPFEVYSVVASRLSPLRRNARRPHRDRQPVRPSAVDAGAAGHRGGAGGAARIDGVRQLLRDAAMARFRRRAHGIGRWRRPCIAPPGCWCSRAWWR